MAERIAIGGAAPRCRTAPWAGAASPGVPPGAPTRPGWLSRLRRIVLALSLLGAGAAWAAPEVVVEDALGRSVRLNAPAERIVALAPHVVENLYAAGVGDRLVGAVAYSDYPPAAKRLPVVGGATNLNLEAIMALRPDLVVAWAASRGGSNAMRARLDTLGVPVYIDRPRRLTDIARTIIDLGTLGGRRSHAQGVAADFRRRLEALRARYADRAPVTLFYQVWDEPLQTLSDDHFVGQVIRLCGGRNVFADAASLAPRVSLEALLVRDPQVIVASGAGRERPAWLDDWKAWPDLRAVARGHLYYVPADLIQRPTLRILEGAKRLCKALEAARE